MTLSPDSSPRRREQSPAKPIHTLKPPLGLRSVPRVAGAYTNTSTLTPPLYAMPPDLTNSGNDYFGSSWQSRTSPTTQPYNHIAVQARIDPLVNPGAKNSFASNTAHSIARTSANAARRKSSMQASRTHATRTTSTSTATESSYASHSQSSPEHEKRRPKKKGPSQKDMLSRALQKANDAVLLDNDADIEGAVAAYMEACSLLKKVMVRSSVAEDKKKLESIRSTYKDRIAELRGSVNLSGNEPDEDPFDVPSGEYLQDDGAEIQMDLHTVGARSTADTESIPLSQTEAQGVSESVPTSDYIATRRLSLNAQSNVAGSNYASSRNAWQNESMGLDINLPPPHLPLEEESAMPAPLSPWRTRSPSQLEVRRTDANVNINSGKSTSGIDRGHSRQDTAESTSWLDTVGESGDSASSVHSRSSSLHEGLRRKAIIRRSGNTEAEFDAALDSAIEAAYDEGLEPAQEEEVEITDKSQTIFLSGGLVVSAAHNTALGSDVRRKVQAARDRVREAEREDALVRGFRKSKIDLRNGRQPPAHVTEQLYGQDEVEEEERMLEEMNEYADDLLLTEPDFIPAHDIPDVNAAPRTALISPGVFTDANTIRSTSSLDNEKGTSSIIEYEIPQLAPPQLRPPVSALQDIRGVKKPLNITPPSLSSLSSHTPFTAAIVSPGVRERRLSGRKIGSLTIDTGAKLDPALAAPKTAGAPATRLSPIGQAEVEETPKSAGLVERAFTGQLEKSMALTMPLNLDLRPETGGTSPAALYFNRTPISETKSAQPSAPASPARSINRPGTANGLRKNFSSTSLKSMKNAIVTPTTAEDSPQTPISRILSAGSQPGHGAVPSVPELPTSAAGTFIRHGVSHGSLSFLNTDIHSVLSPGSPNPAIDNGPAPLEPCPESFLLRPFWLLRCIYQIIANPHGGYLSTRLFVPRDVWRVRNVKLKNVEEKIAQLDMLTAALLKLAKADTTDADAVLEEMQAFELILDQVQIQLQKKLGAEVGVSGYDASASGIDSRSNTTAGRISSSWRKIRSKNSSGPATSTSFGGLALNKDGREALKMNSLPMTADLMVSKKQVKRNPTKILGLGPHANYMAALARLSDAAQILDQVARQVEDPGLRLSSQTHVGLELCTRHAAEFFAFYICRFAISDIGVMLDKFIKRGSEWIMA